MQIFKKAFMFAFGDLDKKFRLIMLLGLAIFNVLLIASCGLYIYYFLASEFIPNLVFFAELLIKSSFSFLSLVIIATVIGNYLVKANG